MLKRALCGLSALFLTLILFSQGRCEPAATAVAERFTGDADANGLPKGWKVFEFPKKRKLTRYSLAKDGEGYVVKAESASSASAIYKEIDLDIREFPVLSWRWKVENVIKDAKEGKKEGDDYAARVYVTFKYEPEKATLFDKLKYALAEKVYGMKPPGNAVTYVWANRLGKEEVIQNPFTDKVMMMAVESGDELAGRWVDEERNVYDDYRRIFKCEPPRATGIVIMTDSDNTRGAATAYYGDIIFKKPERVSLGAIGKVTGP